jgi:subtilisin-like proprotein convertase family protein
MKKILATAAVLAVSASALAVDYNGAGFAIPDNVPAGASSTINVPDSFTVTDVDVTLNNLTHTWVGDLIVTVSHGASSATLVSRIGSADGVGVGDNANFGGNYRFDSQSSNSIWAVALSSADNNFVIPSDTYDTSAPFNGAGTDALNVFNGQNSSGNWTLTISDNASLDTGSLGSWTLHLVPEPTTLSLLALGGLALIRRR